MYTFNFYKTEGNKQILYHTETYTSNLELKALIQSRFLDHHIRQLEFQKQDALRYKVYAFLDGHEPSKVLVGFSEGRPIPGSV